MRSVTDRGWGTPPPHPPSFDADHGSGSEVNPPLLPSKMDQTPKKPPKSRSAPHILYQYHQ